MKDSDIMWIGEMPREWHISKIGSHFKERTDKVSDLDYEPLSVTKDGIVPQLDSAAKSSNHNNRKLVLKDDFVINSRSDRKMSSGIAYQDGSVSVINTVIYSDTISKEYSKYLLKNYSFAEEFYRWGSGIVADLWSTRWIKMKNISIPIPEIREQEIIVKVLDQISEKIDLIIRETEQSIEELTKYKQSIITEALTKGLDPNAEMKDSGINWIGEVPKKWALNQVKTLCSAKNGKEIKNENGKVPVYGSGGVFKYTDRPLYSEVSVLFGRKGTIGKPILVGEEFWTVDTMYYTEINCLRADPMWLFYIMKSIPWGYYSTQTAIPSIVGTEIESVLVPVPSLEVQNEILSYLNVTIKKSDTLIQYKEKVIHELKQYKESLIYEYVTGKKEV